MIDHLLFFATGAFVAFGIVATIGYTDALLFRNGEWKHLHFWDRVKVYACNTAWEMLFMLGGFFIGVLLKW